MACQPEVTGNRFKPSVIFLAALVMCWCSAASGQTYTWNGPFTGETLWSNGNWSPHTPPIAGGHAVRLVFNGNGATWYSTVNNLGDPHTTGNPFLVNRIEFADSLSPSHGAGILVRTGRTLLMGGVNPTISTPRVGGRAPFYETQRVVFASNSLNNGEVKTQQLSGPLTLGGMGTGTLEFDMRVTGDAPLRIVSNPLVNASFVHLNSLHSFTNDVILDGGHLVIGTNLGLGAPTNKLIVNGGWIASTAGNTIPQNIVLNTDLQIMMFDRPMLLGGVISGNGGLRISGLTAGHRSVVLTNANTYTGQTVIDNSPVLGQNVSLALNNGLLNVEGANGSIQHSSAVIVRSGIFHLNDGVAFTGGAMGRVNDIASLSLAGAEFRLSSGATTNYNETMNQLILESGGNAVTITPTATRAAQASFSALVREKRAAVYFRGTALGNSPGANVGNVQFATPPNADLVGGGGAAGSTTISILPYAVGRNESTGTPNSLVTVENGRIRPLSTATEYATSMVGGTATNENVRLTSGINLANANLTTRNALVMTTGTLSNSLGGALRLTSGTILATGPVTISAPLDFGNQEAIVHLAASSVISGRISGSGGLTLAGWGASSNCTLSNVTNDYSGPTTLNSCLVRFSNPSVFGNSTSFHLGGANVQLIDEKGHAGFLYNGSTPASLSQSITINSGLASIRSQFSTGSLQLDGQISGAGGLHIDSTGRVILTNNANNYTGQTIIRGGALVFSNDSQLGDGSSVHISGNANTGIVLDGHWITNRQINIPGFARVDTNGFDWVQNGAFTGSHNSGTLAKSGEGKWILNTDEFSSTYNGAIRIEGGEFVVNGFLGPSHREFVVSSGAGLSGSGSILRSVTMQPGTFLRPGQSPGTLTVGSTPGDAFTLGEGLIFEFEINDAEGTLGLNWDRLLSPHGSIVLPSSLTVRMLGLDATNSLGKVSNFDPSQDYLWEFLTAANFTGVSFSSVNFTIDDLLFVNNNPLMGGQFSIEQIGTSGIGIRFTAAIPEPSSATLLLTCIVALLLGRHKPSSRVMNRR